MSGQPVAARMFVVYRRAVERDGSLVVPGRIPITLSIATDEASCAKANPGCVVEPVESAPIEDVTRCALLACLGQLQVIAMTLMQMEARNQVRDGKALLNLKS